MSIYQFTFARHGDVVDTFILVKRSKTGSRFGFVRFSNPKDANTTIERMNVYVVFGSRLLVSLARFFDILESQKKNHVKISMTRKECLIDDQCHPIQKDVILEGIVDGEDEELLGSEFSIKRAKILTDSMNFIEERVLLSYNGGWDKYLSNKEKKRRDKLIKKKSKKPAQFSFGRDSVIHVPTDSDIARNRIITKSVKEKMERRNSDKKISDEAMYLEAKEALKLGKKLGMQISGNEEVIEELVMIELLKQ
ncbi:hypothetical protein V6N12_013377 [Hibiscus sabdariffa]|uniref:RRM domain-containing protein n=1 Tax=Hibiscus sabdariffa TaxID=183260 RepID=A0ABR2D6Q1_9ROSI